MFDANDDAELKIMEGGAAHQREAEMNRLELEERRLLLAEKFKGATRPTASSHCSTRINKDM